MLNLQIRDTNELHFITRMHSRRMRIARSSSHRGGLPQDQAPPPGPGIPRSRHPPRQIPLNFPLGCGPGPDPSQLPPWLWAWTRSPSTSPLGVGLETPLETCCKACWDSTCNACWDSTPTVDRHTPVNILPCPKLRLRAVINRNANSRWQFRCWL